MSSEAGYVCETIKRIQRICPGQNAVDIWSSRDQSKGPSDLFDSAPEPDIPSIFSLFSNDSGHMPGLFGFPRQVPNKKPESDPFRRKENKKFPNHDPNSVERV